jgi:hypothetical protein
VRFYIAIVESPKRKGRRVQIAVHAASKKRARAMVAARFTKWRIPTLVYAPGEKCIAFMDEFPE